MFYLDHPDFTLIPPLDEGDHKEGQAPHSNSESNGGGNSNSESNFQDATASWRGVAKTQEGVFALLALWGTPQDDPDHPLSVFSWQPTPKALLALRTHFSTSTVCPLRDPLAHRQLWEAALSTAWLTVPPKDTPLSFQVTDDTGRPLNRRLILVNRGTFPPDVRWSDTGDPPTVTPDFWEPLMKPPFGIQVGHDVRIAPDDTDRFVRTVGACRPLGDMHFATLEGPSGNAFFLDYRLARTGEVFCTLDGWWDLPPWHEPLFERTARAFFERPGTVRVGTLPPESGLLSQRPYALAADTLKGFTALLKRARAIANEYSLSVQEKAFEQAFLNDPAGHYALIHPQKGVECLLKRESGAPIPLHGLYSRLENAFTMALHDDDRAFFEAVSHAHIQGASPDDAPVWAQDRLEWGRKRDRADPQGEGVAGTAWSAMACLFDRAMGFFQKDTHEGIASFARSFEGASQKDVFAAPRWASLSPGMIDAFEDPAFMRALEDTGFWGTLEKAPKRHPEWEALLERWALSALGRPCDLSFTSSSPKPRHSDP
jgi:hypothetical protein